MLPTCAGQPSGIYHPIRAPRALAEGVEPDTAAGGPAQTLNPDWVPSAERPHAKECRIGEPSA